MSSAEDELKELKARFVQGSDARFEAIEQAIGRLRIAPADRAPLDELRRRFHGLAGIGATFGFDRVTALGRAAEEICTALLAGDRPASADAIGSWQKTVEQMRRDLAETTPPPEAQPHSAPVLSVPASSGEILIVEDDDDAAALFAKIFEREGLTVRLARSKADALREIETRLPGALVTDIRLPDGSGYEVVEMLRKTMGGGEVGAIVVSGVTGFLDKVEAIRCGADAFFEKPLDIEGLTRRVHLLIERTSGAVPRVLSVEDDPDQAELIRTVLQSAGYEVRICADPGRFEADLISFDPDLILLDVLLPGVTGYDLSRFVRQSERYATLPIIFLTSQTQLQAQIETVRAGGDDYLVKPVPPALLLTNVAARIERARFLKSLLERDGLTGLLTHSAFMERVKASIARGFRRGVAPALVMIDLDRFKSVNDSFGHPVGDRVLAALASLLRRRLRRSDAIGRYGGEEFGAVVEDLDPADAVRLINRLLEEFRAIEHDSGTTRFHVTFSAGVAGLLSDDDLHGWTRRADEALYEAKRAGRDRVVSA